MPFGNSKTHFFPSFWIIISFLIELSSSSFPIIIKVILTVSFFLKQTLSITLELVSFASDLSFFKNDNPLTIISPPLELYQYQIYKIYLKKIKK
jgi:hypothetical protein